MSKAPITSYEIQSTLPFPNLDDLSNVSSEIDNDIAYLLEWLSPCFPPSLLSMIQSDEPWSYPLSPPNRHVDRLKEPSPRVRAAFRSCLKVPSNQLEFVRLYINTIKRNCDEFFNALDLQFKLDFLQNIELIKLVTSYFKAHSAHLNLNSLARNLLQRNLNAVFHSRIVSGPNSLFLKSLNSLLHEHLFDNVSLSTSPVRAFSNTSINLIDIVTLLFSIGLGLQIHHFLVRLSTLKIKLFIAQACAGVWNEPTLHLINEFVQNDICPNFSVIISITGHSSINNDLHAIYVYELVKIAHDELVALRTREFYDIVLQYPDSTIALNEIHQCLVVRYNHAEFVYAPILSAFPPQTPRQSESSSIANVRGLSNAAFLASASFKTQAHQRISIVNAFIDACQNRLLHAGANTVDVIISYTKTIRAFLLVDPKGVLLDKVVRPIRQYLKTRPGVISKLVHGFLVTDPATNPLSELAHELCNAQSPNNVEYTTSLVEESRDLTWIPDPVDALADFKREKVSDIIESLISIFDSMQVFVNEFTTILGNRLLAVENYDIEDTVAHLNLLKARFGKNEFTTLDIMVQDIKDSRIINQKIQETNTATSSFQVSILSHMYWPAAVDIKSSSFFAIPPAVANQFEAFDKGYVQIKKGRRLKFLPHLGNVTLKLEFAGKPLVSFNVSPDKAAIIQLFDNSEKEISLETVKNSLQMSHYNASKGLNFWLNQGVLFALTGTVFAVNENDHDGTCSTKADDHTNAEPNSVNFTSGESALNPV